MRAKQLDHIEGTPDDNMFWYYFSIKLFNFIEKTPPDGVVDSMIFEIENHRISSHYDLHIKNFNSDELKFLIEYQYDNTVSEMGLLEPVKENK